MTMDHHVTKQTRTTNRKSKHGNDQTQNKKKRIPKRGMGMAQLEEKRILKEYLENMTDIPSSLHHPSQNGVVVQFPHHHRHHHHHHQQQQQLSVTSPASPAQQMMYPGMYGSPNLFMDNVVVHPNANPGYRFDNRNQMSFSVPNYVKCGGSDHACGTCYNKKMRINMSGSNNKLNTPNQFRYEMNNVIGKIDYTAKNLCFSPQVIREGRLGYRVWTGGNNGISEYEFFPGKGGGETSTSSWCVSGGGGGTERRGMMIGSHGGEGSSCVTAVTSNEEGSVCCSVDLSLKL